MCSHYLKTMSTCRNNPKRSSATKIDRHATSGYSLFTHSLFAVTNVSMIFLESKTVWKGFVIS